MSFERSVCDKCGEYEDECRCALESPAPQPESTKRDGLPDYKKFATWLRYWWGSPFLMLHMEEELPRACEAFGITAPSVPDATAANKTDLGKPEPLSDGAHVLQNAISPECVLIGCTEGNHVAHCPEWQFHNP